MNVCTVHGEAHHWDDERIEGGIVHQRCACGAGRAFAEEPETRDEEDARLAAQEQARDSAIAARVAELDAEGVGDNLHGALGILLDPVMVPAERRQSEIVNHVLRLIADRDLTAAARTDLTRIDRVEVVDSTGRAFSRRYPTPGATIRIQDEGRTVKLFVDEGSF